MLVIDLDGDDKKEILTGSIDGYLTVVNGATYSIAWDKNLAEYLPNYNRTRVHSGLAAADLDGDGKIEIVIATGGDPINSEGPGAIIVLTYVGGSEYFELMPGWPVLAGDELGRGAGGGHPDGHPDGFTATPSLGDIDGDGDMEIVIGGMDRRLHALHHDGTYVLGWPLAREYLFYRDTRSAAALIDLDGDGVLDIFIGTNNYTIPACPNPYVFYGIKGDTTAIPGFPILTTQNIESSPAIGDINGDGSPDIIFGTGDFGESCHQPGGQSADGKKVYAFDRTGQPLPGWPVKTNADMLNSPALGDLDGDGKPEVIIHTIDTLYAWHGDGSLVQGFPQNGEYHYRHLSPVLADIDGDSMVEILLTSGQVYGPTGEEELQREKLQSPIVVTDQDGDGHLETIGTNHYNYDKGWHLLVYIYQETGLATDALPWPMFHRTPDRTGVLPILHSLSGRIVDRSNNPVPNVEVTLDNGRVVRTDDQGNYLFGSLESGAYTVTPSYQNHRFVPEERKLALAATTTIEPMEMRDAVYDIHGRVLQANGSPLAGITLKLNNSATIKTDTNGIFSFDEQQPGEYTLTPTSPALNYLPKERTLTAEDELPQIFYALPQPVMNTLSPNSATEIEFNDTQSLATRITFPEGLGEEEAYVTPILPDQPEGYLSAGHAFEVALSTTGAGVQSGVVGENGEALAIEIQIHYSQADLQSLLDAEALQLLWKSPDGWVDAQSSCVDGVPAQHNVGQKVITQSVCQWGSYGLFGPIRSLYFPLLVGEGS
jgi:hypothetical protein